MQLTYDSSMFRETFEHEYTWLNGFLRNVRRYGGKTAAIESETGKKWTYSELDRDCNRFANALRKDGGKKSDLMMMQLYNGPHFLFGYIASHKTGIICNPVNFNLSASETAEIMEHNRPKFYIYDTQTVNTAVEALQLSKHKPKRVIAVNKAGNPFDLPKDHILYEDYVNDFCDDAPPIDFTPNIYDETLRLQTSGTTSTPKGVPLNCINEVMSAHHVIMDLSLTNRDVTANLTPWFHRGGIHTTGPNATLYVGGTVVMMRVFDPKICLNDTNAYGITFFTGVPAVLILLANRMESHPVDISSLRGILSMGSPLERETCIRFKNVLTPNIFNGYGTTETLWNVLLRPEDLPDMSGYAGHSSIDDDVRLVKLYDDRRAEPDDLALNDNEEEGEVIIRSPAKTTYSYAGNNTTAAEKFYKGWMYTGDVGIWNNDYCIKIIGRKDDMIISKGENLYPVRIEEVINTHPKVKGCIVVGVPDATRGESVAAYVIPEDSSLTVLELKDFCMKSQNLSRYQVPRYYRFVDELPHTATGKKKNFVVKKQALEDLKNGLLLKK